ncbi:MAG: DoxX family protein [Bacteroidota bacterium]
MKNQLDIGLLLLRITFGSLMLINHGWGKMMNLFGDDPIKFADPIGIGETASLTLAVFAEVLCAALIAVGFLTRWATIPLIITMLVAIFIVHISDPFKKMEMAILYLIPYVVIWINGAGKYSIDALLKKNA